MRAPGRTIQPGPRRRPARWFLILWRHITAAVHESRMTALPGPGNTFRDGLRKRTQRSRRKRWR